MDDLRILRTFVEVVKTGSMADAAVVRNCSGAAVSQQIARLESELGVQLFDRHRDGVKPTAAGAVLMQRATVLLSAVIDLGPAVREAADPTKGTLRLTAFSSACVRMLPEVLKHMRKEQPELTINLIGRYDDQNPFDALLRADTDMLVFHEYDHVPLTIPEGVDVSPLGRDIIDVVLPAKHPLAHRSTLSLSDLQGDDWVLFPRDNIATMSAFRACEAAGFMPNIAFEAGDYQVILALVANTYGVSLQPRLVTQQLRASYAVRPLKGKGLGRSVSVAWRRTTESTPIQALLRAFQRSFSS